jgi:Zn-dependent M28 family amino/carboxypeptidase
MHAPVYRVIALAVAAYLTSAQALEPPAVDVANLRTTIKTLSSDAYGGRAPATKGEELTTSYIAGRYKEYGLRPTYNGSYLQEVPLVQITAEGEPALSFAGATPLTLAYGTEQVVATPRPETDISLKDSPVVFAGFGIVAPEYHWNDYAGLDVKGKTVVVLVNDPGYYDPKAFRGKAMTYYGRWTYKNEEAARQGAAAILIVHDTGPAGYGWQVIQNSFTGPRDDLPPSGGYEPLLQGWLSHEAAGKLLSAAHQNLDELTRAACQSGFKPVALNLSANLTLHNQVHRIISHNVTGLIAGTRHPGQVVIYTAHWDHFGTKPGPDGKPQIFHGAVDNASGIAALIELARVYGRERPAAARSVLFIATTSEEQGLLGSAYYAAHPLFPLRDTVAELNMDTMNMYGKSNDQTVRGQFMSTLDDQLQRSAQQLGMKIQPDAEPEKGYYYRADHFEFAKLGVPALSIDNGTDYVGRPAGWGAQQRAAYVRERYHRPTDVYEPGWDLSGVQQQVQLMYLTGRSLADSDQWPSWYGDSPFRAARQAQRPQ